MSIQIQIQQASLPHLQPDYQSNVTLADWLYSPHRAETILEEQGVSYEWVIEVVPCAGELQAKVHYSLQDKALVHVELFTSFLDLAWIIHQNFSEF